MIFFKSFWKIPVNEAKKAVKEPNNVNKVNVKEENSIKGENLIIRNTPAVTMVAAWIKAETGVGPSIASGSQTCKPSCADLPTAPKTKKKPNNEKNEIFVFKTKRFVFSNNGAKENNVK